MEVPMRIQGLFLAGSVVVGVLLPQVASSQTTVVRASVRDSTGAPVLPSRIDWWGRPDSRSAIAWASGATGDPVRPPDAKGARHRFLGDAGGDRRTQRHLAAATHRSATQPARRRASHGLLAGGHTECSWKEVGA